MTDRDPTPAPRPARDLHVTSRLAEFTSVDALTAATGHDPDDWALVIGKELSDNAIDNCEAHGIAPVIAIDVTSGDAIAISVTDNGSGIAPEAVAQMLDYNVRVSSTEAYVGPTRGRQGNALQVALAIPYALAVKHGDSEPRGVTTIESRGVKHTVVFTTDPIRRKPVIAHDDDRKPSRRFVQSGTRITVGWPLLACSQLEAAKGRFVRIAQDLATLNPHLSITLTWAGERMVAIKATNPTWPKWRPSDPMVAHWYSPERFDRLIAATIAHDQDHGRDTLVREFIAGFRGMKRSSAQTPVLDAVDAHRMSLATLFANKRQGDLLTVLKDQTKPTKATELGVIGRAHLEDDFDSYGAGLDGSFKYATDDGITDGVPWVLEAAFAYFPEAEHCTLVTGCNWTPSLGETFAGLGALLAELRVKDDDPVMVAVHLAHADASFTDKGKTKLALPYAIRAAVTTAVTKITKDWTKQRKAEERDASARARRDDQLSRKRTVSIVDAAAEIMKDAYLIASANGTLPANARQIYYAARAYILTRIGKTSLRSSYFQTVLVKFMKLNPDLTADWDIAYDDRGHFTEPHTNHEIGLGTLAVREYLNECKTAVATLVAIKDAHVATRGPNARYSGILLIEKEGFDAILEAVQLAERFDLAVMSSKGIQTVAARKIAEAICSTYDIPLYVLHDFDKNGMAIAALSKRSNERYQFTRKFKVIDLGFRLADVEEENLLGSAESHSDKGTDDARGENLRLNGATEAEVEFLLDQRVELNALPSDRFVAYVERKLIEAGAHKVVPGKRLLAQTYRAIRHSDLAKPAVEAAITQATKTRVEVPDDLQEQVDAMLEANPHIPWDEAVAIIVRGEPDPDP